MREGADAEVDVEGMAHLRRVIAVLIMIRLFAWENEWVRFGGLLLIIGFSLWTLSRMRAEGRETRGDPGR
jgi:hypothetical protein